MPIDFYDLGNRSIIDKTLQRLTHSHELRRIDRGFYDKLKMNVLTGQANAPDYHAIIDAVARRDQVRILLDGITCANEICAPDYILCRYGCKTALKNFYFPLKTTWRNNNEY